MNKIEEVYDFYSNSFKRILSITTEYVYSFDYRDSAVRKFEIASMNCIRKYKSGITWCGTNPKFLFEVKGDIYIFCEKHIIKYTDILQCSNYLFFLNNDKTESVPTEFELLENYLPVNSNTIYAYLKNKLYAITIFDDSFDFKFVIEINEKILNIIKKSECEICIILNSEILIFNIDVNKVVKRISTNEGWIFSFCKNNEIHRIDFGNKNLEIIEIIELAYRPVEKLKDVSFTYC